MICEFLPGCYFHGREEYSRMTNLKKPSEDQGGKRQDEGNETRQMARGDRDPIMR